MEVSGKTLPLKVQGQKSFTLIELLVVVAIIAVLISILLPALASAREQGHKAVCLSNLHQNAVAMRYYADDHNGVLVQHKHDDPNVQWPELILPYAASKEIFLCPTIMRHGLRVKWPNTNHTDYGYASGFDYVAYSATPRMNPGFESPLVRTRDSITPPNTIILLDGSYIPMTPFPGWDPRSNDVRYRRVRPYYQFELGPINLFGIGDWTFYCHTKKVNVLFHDGHVGSFNQLEFFSVWIRGYSGVE